MSTAFTQVTAVPIDGALPPQNTTTNGMALISNGTSAGWNTVLSMIGGGSGQTPGSTVANAVLPAQTGNSGRFLTTDGAGNLTWGTPNTTAGVSSIVINGTSYTGAVTITNVPTATTAAGLSTTLPISSGGTGATSAAGALTALGAAAANHTHNYAPVDSPAFTGNPTAPTPAVGDNDTSIATTAFVKAVTQASSQSIGAVGYATLPGGLIIQWGTTSIVPTDGSSQVQFSTPFPTSCASVVAQQTYGSGGSGVVMSGWAITSKTNTGFTIINDHQSQVFYWIAVGY